MDHKTQIGIEEAISIIQAQARGLGLERVPLSEAYGRTLAQTLTSLADHPNCDNSALDGYACRAADTLGASQDAPARLKVVGEVPAGRPFAGAVGPGAAVSIYTGAPVPEGADAIIGVERTKEDGDGVLLYAPASPGDIRPRAQDLRAGEVYLRAGTRLTPAAVGVAAAMGYADLEVVRAPRVGILSTGDEIVEPGVPLKNAQVYNSNAYSVAGLVKAAGGVPLVLPRALDTLSALHEGLKDVGGVDLLVTSGGVSMGKYDFVRDLLFGEGRVHFWKVAMRPGGPALFGEWRGLSVFGLPGNPVSSMVVFLLLTEAWFHKALGSTDPLLYHRRIHATARSPFKGAGFKEAFWRCVLEFGPHGPTVRTTGNQSSGILTSMLFANALAVVPPHGEVREGAGLEVIPLSLHL